MRRLYWKLFLFLLLAQFSAILIISGGFWLHQHNRVINSEGVEISPPARTIAQSAGATLKHGGKPALLALFQEWQTHRMPQVFAVDNNGHELLGRSYSPQALATARALVDEQATQSVNAIQLPNGETFTLFVPDTGHHRPPHADDGRRPPPKPLLRPMTRSIPIWPISASVFVSLCFAALIAWYFSKPIQVLQAAFSRGAKGDLDSQVANKMGNRKDAFSDLGHDFDAMASRLGKLLLGQKRLLNHVSHELRSPLSRIQIAIGLAKQNAEKIPSSLDRIQLESERIDYLVGELLQLSRLESGVSSIQKTSLNLSHLLQDMVHDASFEAAEKNITVYDQIAPDCILNGDPELLYRAIENIIRNALKYTAEGSKVVVTLEKLQQVALINVIDQGDGVDEHDLEEIFQPFVRTNHAQPKHGYGIGLALAKQVVEAHGGQIEALNNTPDKGLTVKISLPF